MRAMELPRLPAGFWLREDVRQALVRRDFGALFKVLSKFGVSQTQIAIAVGMTQGQVSMIANGSRRVTAIEVAERALDGLDAPDGARLAYGLAPRGPAVVGAVMTIPNEARTEQTTGANMVPGTDSQHASTVDSVEQIAARMRRLGQSNVDEVRLAYLETLADAAIVASERRSPDDLLPYVRRARSWVDDLLAGQQHPSQRERLYVTAVKLSGLMGSLSLDLGQWSLARAYGMEAFELASYLELPNMQAWTRATQSLIEYYAGSYHDALAYAQHGQRLAADGPQSVRLALNGEARALARLGDLDGVDDAVARGLELLEALPPVEGMSPSLSLDVYCRARSAANIATAYLVIQKPAKAYEYAGAALAAFDAAGLRGPQALSRLDQATALLLGGKPDPEQACTVLVDAMSYVEDERFESVVQRSREFIRSAESWNELPAVREARELVRTRSTRPALEADSSYDRGHGDARTDQS